MRDKRRPEHIHYFLGVDPAPSEGEKSDDGALIVLQALPRHPDEVTKVPSDWMVNVVFGERVRKSVRGKEKGFSAREWAGKIHKLHHAFTFARICMDPNGGGQFIMRELASAKTVIDGAERLVTSIVAPDNIDVGVSFPILSLFKRGDWAIDQVWQGLGGDEVLNHVAYQELKTAMELGIIGFIPPEEEWPPEEVAQWPENRQWALKVLAGRGGESRLVPLPEQLLAFFVQTNADGTVVVNKRGALLFGSTKKKDLLSAFMMAYVAFLTWLQMEDFESMTESGEAGFRIF